MTTRTGVAWQIVWITLFGVSFAFVEASVVVYLRALYYPQGFSLPLQVIPAAHLSVELAREFATLVMLAAAGMIAGKSRWQRFGYFIIAFGVWDIFYYVWLKVMLGWPATLVDWDILFLLPEPWIGPVVAPVLIALAMVCAGADIVRQTAQGKSFHPGLWSWLIAILATAVIMVSFMMDTPATIEGRMPQPYHYELLIAGMLLYGLSMAIARRRRGGEGEKEGGIV